MSGEDERLLRFLNISGRLKKEPRRGWVVKVGVKSPESVADHTFRTVLLAMLLGDLRRLDTEKMMRMALIHDLAESLIGDIMSDDDASGVGDKGGKEEAALQELLSSLPDRLREDYLELWRELRSCGSVEARLVSDADKFEMALQASEYGDEGYSKDALSEFKTSAMRWVKDAQMRRLIERL